MNRKIILSLFSGAAILLLSGAAVVNSAGTSNWTGSPIDGGPGTGGQCSACHNGGASGVPTLALTSNPAFGGSGNALQYSPGTTYTITITPSGSYAVYGMNCEIINSQSSTTVGAFGTWGAAVTSNCKIFAASSPYPSCLSHNMVSTTPWSCKWTAPASGTGYIYANVLGANHNGATSGDEVSAVYSATLTPASGAGIATAKESETNISVFPNPVIDRVTINFGSISGAKIVQLYDINGKLVLEKNTFDATIQVDLTSVTKGTYFVKVSDGSQNVIAVKMIMLSK